MAGVTCCTGWIWCWRGEVSGDPLESEDRSDEAEWIECNCRKPLTQAHSDKRINLPRGGGEGRTREEPIGKHVHLPRSAGWGRTPDHRPGRRSDRPRSERGRPSRREPRPAPACSSHRGTGAGRSGQPSWGRGGSDRGDYLRACEPRDEGVVADEST